jgi:hypothetical protein
MVTVDDLQLQAGTRLLHIGPHKTGTTAVQGAFHLARRQLAEAGVVYAGPDRQPMLPALAVTGRPPLLGGPSPVMANWTDLVREVRDAGPQRVVVSSEFFADADEAAARRIVEDLGGPRVHVVVTLRPLSKLLPSQWQQYLQNGLRMPYAEWLEGILAQPARTPTPNFWYRHGHDRLIARWAAIAGPQNVTAIVVNESDRSALLRSFEALLGLPGGILVPEDGIVNRSLTLAETELVRLLNEEFKRRAWTPGRYSKFMRYGAVEQLKARMPVAAEQRVVTPAWALERASQIGAAMADNIASAGVRIVGDLTTLGRPAAEERRPDADATAGLMIPVDAAVQAVLGAFMIGGVAGQTVGASREIAARILLADLAQRGWQRARRSLPWGRGGETPVPSAAQDPRNLLDRDAAGSAAGAPARPAIPAQAAPTIESVPDQSVPDQSVPDRPVPHPSRR